MANRKPRPDSGSLPGVLFGSLPRVKQAPRPDADDAQVVPSSFRAAEMRAPSSWPAKRNSSLPPLAPAEPLPRLVSSGTYDVVLELGGGAMATVYMAVKSGSSGFKKIVALKRIHKHLAGNANFVDMLVDEARLASRINHPNVCQVLDFGCDDSGYYIALEFLSGQTLHSVFEALTVNPEMVARSRHQFIASRIIASLAQGLHAAHCLKGDDGLPMEVVHRDVTPHNLFLLYDGVAKITDFGVARARSRLHHTVDGTLKGKFAYMAPEQISRGKIDRRADVFALGVVFWELLTGRRLFDCKSEGETLSAICAGQFPAPSSIQPRISPNLDHVVLRALSVDEDERYQTAREFSGALEVFLARAADTVPQVDIVDWLAELFPGAEAYAEAIQRRAVEGPSALSMERVQLAPTTSVAQLKTAHVADEELWPVGDSSPPSRNAPSAGSIMQKAQQEQQERTQREERREREREEQRAREEQLREQRERSDRTSRPRSVRPVIALPAPASTWPSVSGATLKTLLLVAFGLVLGISGGILLLRERLAGGSSAKPPPSPAVPAPSAVAGPAVPTAVASALGPPATPAKTLPAAEAPSAAAPAAPLKTKPEPSSAQRADISGKPSAAPAQEQASDSGSVFISTTGGAATVQFNGNVLGQTPLLINLPSGHRTVTLVPIAGGSPRELSVEVKANGTVMLSIALPAVPAPAPPPAAPAPSAVPASATSPAVPPAPAPSAGGSL